MPYASQGSPEEQKQQTPELPLKWVKTQQEGKTASPGTATLPLDLEPSELGKKFLLFDHRVWDILLQ